MKIQWGLPITKKLFSKGYTENCSKEIFVIDFVLITNPWTDKNIEKQYTGKTIIGHLTWEIMLLKEN